MNENVMMQKSFSSTTTLLNTLLKMHHLAPSKRVHLLYATKGGSAIQPASYKFDKLDALTNCDIVLHKEYNHGKL